MSACQIERLPEGSFRVSRVFSNKAAAMAAVQKVMEVVEEAFEPAPPPLSPAAEVSLAKAEAED